MPSDPDGNLGFLATRKKNNRISQRESKKRKALNDPPVTDTKLSAPFNSKSRTSKINNSLHDSFDVLVAEHSKLQKQTATKSRSSECVDPGGKTNKKTKRDSDKCINTNPDIVIDLSDTSEDSESAPLYNIEANMEGDFTIDNFLSKISKMQKKKVTKRKVQNAATDSNSDFELDNINGISSGKKRRRSKRLSAMQNNEPKAKEKGKINVRGKTRNGNSCIPHASDSLEQMTDSQDTGTNSRNNLSQSTGAVRGQVASESRDPSRANRGGRKLRPKRNIPVPQCYPTINIGNCDEYQDNSDKTPLFSSKPIDVVNFDDELEENEELSVKVYWRNSKVFRFNIRKFQKLKQIFEFFSEKEQVGQQQLLFTFNDSVIKIDDTPDSIGYNIVKFIDGGIINENINDTVKENHNERLLSGIHIKFQYENARRPYEISIQPDDRLSLALLKCAEHLETPLNKLRFEFDGDCISGTNTAKDLGLEGGECIDVKIIK